MLFRSESRPRESAVQHSEPDSTGAAYNHDMNSDEEEEIDRGDMPTFDEITDEDIERAMYT